MNTVSPSPISSQPPVSGASPLGGEDEFFDVPLDPTPVGQLNGRSVQHMPSGGPRSLKQALVNFGHQIKDVCTRTLTAIKSAHASVVERNARKAFNNQVKNLLAALSVTPNNSVDGMTAERILDRLLPTAKPLLTRVNYLEMCKEQVEHVVETMSVSEYAALYKGVAMAQESPLAETQMLHTISEACNQYLPSSVGNFLHGDKIKLHDAFRAYLAKEFSLENLTFLSALDDLREATNPGAAMAIANHMEQRFIRKGSAAEEINLSGANRKQFLAGLATFNAGHAGSVKEVIQLFDGVKADVYLNLADPYSRFKSAF